MTEREKYISDFIISWEGKGGTDGRDCGWTASGVTLCTYRYFFGKDKSVEDLKNMTPEEWFKIFRSGFYDKVKGDNIENDSLCLLVVDWAYNAGCERVIRNVQTALGCRVDGIIGKETLGMLNKDPKWAFDKVIGQRRYFYRRITEKNPKNKKYLKGWLNRTNAIKYKAQAV